MQMRSALPVGEPWYFSRCYTLSSLVFCHEKWNYCWVRIWLLPKFFRMSGESNPSLSARFLHRDPSFTCLSPGLWYTLSLHPAHAIFLFAAATVAGGLNAIAGGGSFISFPALVFAGVPEIPANATNNIGAWAGLMASTGAYRNHLNVPRRVIVPLLLVAVSGGTLGALLLLKTPAHTFRHLIPWLMLAATLLFIFGKKLIGKRESSVRHDAKASTLAAASFFLFLASVYGGYFGGGLGIVLLALLAALGMTDMHAMNAFKTVLSASINGPPILVFVIARVIYWPQAVLMMAGFITGGYLGGHYGQRLPQSWVRGFVMLVAIGMTIYFFAKTYG